MGLPRPAGRGVEPNVPQPPSVRHDGPDQAVPLALDGREVGKIRAGNLLP